MLQQAAQAYTGIVQTAVGNASAGGQEFRRDLGKQAAAAARIGGMEGELPTFFPPERDIALYRLVVSTVQGVLHAFQAAAPQPGGAGQIIPPGMQVGEGEAGVERVFDFKAVTSFIVMMADVQGLMDISHQVNEPGQSIGALLFADMVCMEDATEPLNLPVKPALDGLPPAIHINVVPVEMAQGVAKAARHQVFRIGAVITEARVVTNVIRPG